MTTILAHAQKDPVIPVKPVIKQEDYKEVTLSLERYKAGAGGRGTPGHWNKLKEKTIFCTINDKEYIIRTILEFGDVASEDRMDLDTAKLKHQHFRQCLGGEVLSAWDNAKLGKPITEDGWQASLMDFLSNYLKPSDLTAQKKYMENFKMTHAMPVKTLAERLVTLNMYMSYFPGSGGINPYHDIALKNILFQAMPLPWQIDFAKAGHHLQAGGILHVQPLRFILRFIRFPQGQGRSKR